MRVCVVGMFPPPVNGMALLTEHVAREVLVGPDALRIDCSPKTYRLRGAWVRFSKLVRQFARFAEFAAWAARGRGSTLYLALSGGYGQAYDLVFVALARLFGARAFVHHHGYAYIERHSPLTAAFVRVAGAGAVHVVACERMAEQLRDAYPGVGRVRIVSGVVCLPSWQPDPAVRVRLARVGYISNISREKGIDEFLALAHRTADNVPGVRFLIAGQFQDDASRERVERACAVDARIEYVGPKYGDEKRAFYDGIDLLVFPTHSESEGLVIHEASSRGVPVIAPDRGCIGTVLDSTPEFVCAAGEDFVGFASARLDRFVEAPGELAEASARCIRGHRAARANGLLALQALRDDIVGSANGEDAAAQR